MTRTLPFFAALALLSTATWAAEPKTMTRAEVEKIIAEYLDAHPEVILQSVAKFQERQQNAQKEQASAALQNLKNDVFNNPDSPVYGAKDGVKIVYFYDYNCPACKMMFKNIETYMKTDPKIQVVFKEYPIFGEQSEQLARIALAVYHEKPEKFYQYHVAMMNYQGRADMAKAEEMLAAVGLDVAAIKKEADKPIYADMVADTTELAAKLGATGTPMVIIGDEVTPHALGLPEIAEQVAKAKAKK